MNIKELIDKIKEYKDNIANDILSDEEIDELNKKIYSIREKIKKIKESLKYKSSLKNSPKNSDKNSKEQINISDNDLYYPDIDDENFVNKLNNLHEYRVHKVKKFNKIDKTEFNNNTIKMCGEFEKTYYQHLISHYISNRSPYNSCLLYHGVGVGKTCSAITLSENLLLSHSQYDDPKIWVIMPSALRSSFKEQIFTLANFDDYKILSNQCTGDTYIKMTQLLKDTNKDKAALKIKKFINSRYRLFTYDEFAKMIENSDENIEDKVIIIDEAHNIRNSSKNEDKRIYLAITKALENGSNNKLILLSATPMYNEPSDILDLLYLFLLNDKRDDILKKIKPPFSDLFNKNNDIKEDMEIIIKKLSNNYISYLRGKNPFTFAIKLTANDNGFNTLDKIIPNDPSGNPIPETDNKWIDRLEEGITISKLSDNQKKLLDTKKELNENNVLANLQPMNIVYDNKTGSNGFSNFFNRLEISGSLKVTYRSKYLNGLYPDEENLGKYSGKFLTISNFIKKAKGIVIIYSRFVEGGILPLALILEHMGFMREGEKNILDKPKIISDAPKYGFGSAPKYCIMTSHSENNNVMGSSSIDKLLPIINNKKNINGELVKVILMTPVASEGLSFYNAREMHIIEPWYHFNKTKQIIGRGIRNCRHNSLPLEERNMTIYTHASFNDYNNETADIHAYRISSKKLDQSNKIEEIIRDNAFDCYLMKNMNYFPKNIFNFDIDLISSQNKIIKYNYGDSEYYEPKCKMNSKNINKNGFRKETYNHLIFNIKKIIKNLVLNKLHNGERFLKIEEIKEFSKLDNNIIFEAIKDSIYPNILIENYILVLHNNGIHIIDILNKNPTKLRIVYEKNKDSEKDAKEIKNLLPEDLTIDITDNIDNNLYNTISIYLSFDSILYDNFVNYIIKTDYNLLKNEEKYIAKCFFSQGALIHKNELNIYNNDSNIEYIGYFNIFDINSDINLYNFETKRFKSLSNIDKEFISIISNRNELSEINNDISYGIIVPKTNKDKSINNFKIISSGQGHGKKTGIVCETLLKAALDIIIKEYSIDLMGKKNTKSQKCKIMAKNMLKVNRLIMYPIYKPKI